MGDLDEHAVHARELALDAVSKRAKTPFEAIPLLPEAKSFAVPASVVTTPDALTLRIEWFPLSATNTASPTTATPLGYRKEAEAPCPSPFPAIPDPASVLTTPDLEIFRMRWFAESATMTFPC